MFSAHARFISAMPVLLLVCVFACYGPSAFYLPKSFDEPDPVRHARAWGAKKQHTCYTASTRATVASEPFVNQMRRGNVHVNASRKTFKNIYARLLTFHRMGASQERAAFFCATSTRHRGCIPAGRQADGKFTLPSRFAFFFISESGLQVKSGNFLVSFW